MVELLTFFTLLVIGYVAGSTIESNHYKSIRQREEQFVNLPTIALKTPLNQENIESVKLVSGSTIISIDYFKMISASLRNIFGGNVSAYETLIDRARRESILRLKEEAKDADEIINIKIETSSISKNAQGNVGAVEVLAYGTAIYRKA